MSLLKSEDSKKWINTLLVITGAIATFVVIRFVGQMSEWFDLEAKVPNFAMVTQGIGILAGVLTFTILKKNSQSATHLKEVYDELVKVIWPDNESVVRVTIGIIVAVTFISGMFVAVDFVIQKILELLY